MDRLSRRLEEYYMIQVCRINGETIYINPDSIEYLEETSNTVITLASGRKVVVSDSALDIQRKIIIFRRRYLRRRTQIVRGENDRT